MEGAATMTVRSKVKGLTMAFRSMKDTNVNRQTKAQRSTKDRRNDKRTEETEPKSKIRSLIGRRIPHQVKLPDELWLNVLGNDNLNQFDLAQVSKVNHQLHALVSDRQIWDSSFTRNGESWHEWTARVNSLKKSYPEVRQEVLKVFQSFHTPGSHDDIETKIHAIGRDQQGYRRQSLGKKLPDMSSLVREAARQTIAREADEVCKYIASGQLQRAEESIAKVKACLYKLPQDTIVRKLDATCALEGYTLAIKNAQECANRGDITGLNLQLDFVKRWSIRVAKDIALCDKEALDIMDHCRSVAFDIAVWKTRKFAHSGDASRMRCEARYAEDLGNLSKRSLPNDWHQVLGQGLFKHSQLLLTKHYLVNARKAADAGNDMVFMEFALFLAREAASRIDVDLSRHASMAHISKMDYVNIRASGYRNKAGTELANIQIYAQIGNISRMNAAIDRFCRLTANALLPQDWHSESIMFHQRDGYTEALRRKIREAWAHARLGCEDDMERAIKSAQEYAAWLGVPCALSIDTLYAIVWEKQASLRHDQSSPEPIFSMTL